MMYLCTNFGVLAVKHQGDIDQNSENFGELKQFMLG